VREKMGLIDAMKRRAKADGNEESVEALEELQEDLRPMMEAIDDREFAALQSHVRAIGDAMEHMVSECRKAGYPENLAHAKAMECIFRGSTPWPETPEAFEERKFGETIERH
jgi:hypothetical protein